MKNEIEYCGHVINKDGLCKPQKKIEAVVNAPNPQNVNQLRSWLGFDTPWHRKKEQEAAFTKVKSMVASDTVLTHYGPDKELRLATDESAYGLGCVLSHVMPDVKELRKETRSNPILAKVIQVVLSGWPAKQQLHPDLLPYFHKREDDGCLLWGGRVIVPPKLQQRVLEELREGLIGIVKMKGLPRSYFWWPGLDSQIESTCTSEGCTLTQNNPPAAPVHRWEFPEKPWCRVHIDFAEPFMNSMFLVAVDAHSKWPEVHIMSSTTSSKTIQVLRTIFATHGLPTQIVYDNGSQLRSEEFETFLKMNGIQHLTSAPYHPRTNGLAKRFVRTMKEALKSDESNASLRYKLDTFPMKYRNCPHTTTGNSPAVMLMGDPLRCRLDLLKPHITRTVEKSFVAAPSSKQMRHFNIGIPVLARNHGRGNLWSKGIVSKQTGPVSYQVQVSTSTWRRHLDQLRRSELPSTESTSVTMTTTEPQVSEEKYQESQTDAPSTVDTPDVNSSQVISESQNRTPDDVQSKENSNTQAPVMQDPKLRESRPVRNRKSPVWMKDYVAK
ncbi:uncharacterized protein K02A2.6-like [Stylophora pistillata]|uniref:uncharacterized protein K02A2.6-like n=1 Tax=Stylophora pistillata TaxID=50429 RepID=UPI000C04C7AF|nr:uncharacterized protein K02A2.6-like [Stylophora pistillata]